LIAPEAADAAVPKVSQLSRGLADRLAILNFKVLTGEPTLHLVIYGPIKIYDFGKQWVESSWRRIESRLGKRRFSGRARQRGANHPISLAVHGIQDIRLCWYKIVGKVLKLARGIEPSNRRRIGADSCLPERAHYHKRITCGVYPVAKNIRTAPGRGKHGMELARGIEPPTGGLQIGNKGLPKYLTTWAIPF
jgi:hypothetical protein